MCAPSGVCTPLLIERPNQEDCQGFRIIFFIIWDMTKPLSTSNDQRYQGPRIDRKMVQKDIPLDRGWIKIRYTSCPIVIHKVDR